MALKLKYARREDVPAEQQSLYVERDGAWHLDVEQPSLLTPLPADRRGEPDAMLKLPPPMAEKPREQRTLRDEMAARETHVAQMQLESAVREAARRHGAGGKTLESLAQRARYVFRIVEGRAVPVAEDGRTVLRSAAPEALRACCAQWRVVRAKPRSSRGSNA